MESLLIKASEKKSQVLPIPGYRANNTMAVTLLKQAGTTISCIEACVLPPLSIMVQEVLRTI